MNRSTAILAVWNGGPSPEVEAIAALVEAELRTRGDAGAVTRALLRPDAGQPGVAETLDKLAAAGCRRVRVLAALLTAGEEYEKLAETVRCAAARMPETEIALSPPLFGARSNIARFAAAAGRTRGGGPLLWIGHGSRNPAALRQYAALAEALAAEADGAPCFFGWLRGAPGVADAVRAVAAAGIDRIELRPFLLLPGGHLRRDIAGDAPRAAARLLREAGIEPGGDCRALLEYPAIRQEFAAMLREAGNC